MVFNSEKVGVSPPPKASTKLGVKSINLTMGLENTNIVDVLRKNPHRKILEWLGNKNLGDTAYDRTLCYHILKNTINGDQLVSKKLDDCVSANKLDNTDPDYRLQIDFSRLTGQEGSINSDVIRDILSIKHDAAEKLLLHPVTETFIDLKWKSTKKYFFVNFIIYLVFLLSFSLFLANIFYRPLQKHTILVIDDIIFPNRNPNSNDGVLFSFKPKPATSRNQRRNNIMFVDQDSFEDDISSRINGIENRTRIEVTKPMEWNNDATFSHCMKDSWSVVCVVEVILAVAVLLLFTIEILQLMSVGVKTYCTNFENMIELTVISLASVCLGAQENEELEKWFAAFGIVLAYIELVFLLGRYPPLGGRISIMFYNITRHLTKSLLNLFVLVIGFGFGFFIMHRNAPNDNFENPGKAIVKTLIMVLGEYEFNDMFDGKFDTMPYAYAFNLALLVFLAIIGSLVMVNLFVAIIVSDIDKLKYDGKIEEIRQKVYHIINCENILSCLHHFKDDVNESSGSICTHSLCFNCKGIKVATETKIELENIARKNKSLIIGSRM